MSSLAESPKSVEWKRRHPRATQDTQTAAQLAITRTQGGGWWLIQFHFRAIGSTCALNELSLL
jgi:hypothetical protein